MADHLPVEHDFDVKESAELLHLRNRILGITRAQAKRTEKIQVESDATE